MKRAPAISAVLLLACAGGATAIASASTHGSTALAARAAKVQVSHSSLGNILTTSSGSTLFEFTRDSAGKDSCAKVSGCLQIWPALTTSGRPVAGSGVRASLLSSVKLSGGSSQVTYAGHPLYLYSGDSRADETGYVASAASRHVGGDQRQRARRQGCQELGKLRLRQQHQLRRRW